MQIILTLLVSLSISLTSNAMMIGPGSGSGSGGDQGQGQNQSQTKAKKFAKVTKGEKVEICQTKVTKAPKNDQSQSQFTCQGNTGGGFDGCNQQTAQSNCQQNDEVDEIPFVPEQSSQQTDVKEVELSDSDEGCQGQQDNFAQYTFQEKK